MLRISKKADYAVFLLGAIARQGAYPGGPAADTVVSAQEIARQAGLNKSVVANLLKAFAKQGLLESVRGLKGGYRLVRPPAEISLGEMLEVVEGRFTLVDCVSATGWAGPSLTKAIPPALALAPGQHGNGKIGEHGHDCTLIGFCPSKNPMRLVHERISQLFRQIRLDELCSMTDARSPTTREPALAQTATPNLGSPR
ncbi:MAG TPA: Rrf2 family transcriptional regulator [Planctomycetota bacterium]|nr:Rrf2 family transcriptional regulator [Planctomycetota bacterium]